ncbi:MAG: carotenoid biosynthesis protein [Anaerolineales bacterium]|nr:carotenoid biosynthesis protein [Anaerolineales bacterium]
MLTAIRIQAAKLELFSWTTLLIAAWVLTMISIPIIRWTLGDAAKLPFINAGVLLQALAVLMILQSAWGWRRTATTAVSIALFTFSVEALGAATGIPFGHYDYTSLLQPQLLNVPLLIPAAWLMMLPPAWATAAVFLRPPRRHNRARLSPRRQRLHALRQRALFVGLSALSLTAWDLLLDPQMVNWNLWVWHEPGGYFGIPWQNFFGWFATAAILTAVLKPDRLPVRPLLVIYTITWFLEVVGLALFWGMPGPAVAGGIVMLACTIVGWRYAPPEAQT